jgi:hypothetical protein
MKTRGRRQRKSRQTKRKQYRYKRGGTRSVDNIVREARSKDMHPLLYYVIFIAKLEPNSSVMKDLINQVAETGQLDQRTAITSLALILHYNSNLNGMYNEHIRQILLLLKPITDIDKLEYLYDNIMDYNNIDALIAMRDAGHVPLTAAHKDFLIQMYNRNANSNPEFRRILESMRTAAETQTSNTIYSLEQRNIYFPSMDDEEELHSHLHNAFNDSYDRYLQALAEYNSDDEENSDEDEDEDEDDNDGDY